MGHGYQGFLDNWLMWAGHLCKRGSWANQGKPVGKRHPCRLCFSSCPGFFLWWTITCKPPKPFPPQVAIAHHFYHSNREQPRITGSHCATHAGLKLTILLLGPRKSWDYRRVSRKDRLSSSLFYPCEDTPWLRQFLLNKAFNWGLAGLKFERLSPLSTWWGTWQHA